MILIAAAVDHHEVECQTQICIVVVRISNCDELVFRFT